MRPIAATTDACAGSGSGASSAPTSSRDRASSGAKASCPARGQRQQALAPVDRRWRAREQPIALEALQDAAEIAGIEIQFAAKFGGRNAGALGEFVQHAGLGQREAAVQQALLQGADDARVEAAEPPDGGDAVSQAHADCQP